jgi:hypothetical protein
MYELKNIGKLFTSKFVGPRALVFKKIIHRTAVSQRLGNTAVRYGGNTKKEVRSI